MRAKGRYLLSLKRLQLVYSTEKTLLCATIDYMTAK